MKKKIIIIDAKNREIREEQVDTIDDMQAIVDGFIVCAAVMKNGDGVLVNEEGHMRSFDYGFQMPGEHKHAPFIGNALVIGDVMNGFEGRECKSTVELIRGLVTFIRIPDTI